jgi:hypothetical protein
VLELSTAMLVGAIVVASAGEALISLSNATGRHDATVQEEQADSQVMAQIERDIRSAVTISIPSGAAASQQLELAVANSNGSSTNVLWIYNPTARTFSRQVQVQGSFASSGYSIPNVSNGSGKPVFTYSNLSAADISSSSASNIAQCATAVSIDIHVSSPTKGVGGFQESAEVALTDRLEILTAPGNGYCGVTG